MLRIDSFITSRITNLHYSFYWDIIINISYLLPLLDLKKLNGDS